MIFDTLLIALWDLVESFVNVIGSVWNWLSSELVINISWLRIPVILPEGIHIETGLVPLAFFGIGVLTFMLLWAIKSLIPFL